MKANEEFNGYIVRVTRFSVLPKNEPLFSEQCTNISIVDEAAGEYLEVEQQFGNTENSPRAISITPEEWPAIKLAIEKMIEGCKTKETT